MKNTAFKTLASLLCIGLLAALFAGCSLPADGNAQTSGQPTEVTEPVEEPVPVEDLEVVSQGASDYVIVRSKDADGTGDLIAALAEAINTTASASLEVINDKDELPEGKSAIVIGDTSLPESAEALEGLKNGQFRFLVKDRTLIIAVKTPECLELALDTFRSEYLNEEGITVPGDLDRTWQCSMEVETREVTNPINPKGDDPDVVYHDGVYYYCWSGGGVMISKADSLDKISKEGGVRVYAPPQGTMYSKEYWAPELHYINGEWYVYVAADDGNDANHRMYVLKGTSQDPMQPFEMVGKISDPSDKWAIDGTVITIEGEMYFVWSGWAGDNEPGNQRIYIAHMSDPCTIDGKRVQLSAHEKSWEGGVNEGPYGVEIDGTTYIIYSANGSWDDYYCLAYLKLEKGADPLKAKSWTKSEKPILNRSTSVFGPGHASIVKMIDGSYWLAYHANLESGTGWKGRSVWIQPLVIKSNGEIKLVQTPKKTVDFPVSVKWKLEGEITG